MSGPVFVSYGHKDASEFVLRLKKDLKDRGISPVWLDSDRIDEGQAWTSAIERGIRDSEVVLALMTGHSLREESICQDEVAFAQVEGKTIVPVRVESDVRPTLLLVRRSWVDFTDDYDAALQRLLRALQGDTSGLTEPLMTVAGQRPLDFGLELARHRQHFTGRQWLFDELEEWLTTSPGACLILGEPGIGQAAISAQLARRPDCAVVHFCSAGNAPSQSPLAFVANLVATLSARVPGFGAAVADRHPEQARENAVTAFRDLVLDPARYLPCPHLPSYWSSTHWTKQRWPKARRSSTCWPPTPANCRPGCGSSPPAARSRRSPAGFKRWMSAPCRPTDRKISPTWPPTYGRH